MHFEPAIGNRPVHRRAAFTDVPPALRNAWLIAPIDIQPA
jgi:hypothetical protein